MNILAVDTSTALASIAVSRDGLLAGEVLFGTDRTLSARLLPELERLLDRAGLAVGDIDLFACALGPGSFTGVRAGVATIQGLALATGRPCVGYPTLAALAMNLAAAPVPVCPLLDARKSEVYAGLYECTAPLPAPLRPDCVVAPELLCDRLRDIVAGPVLLVGDGAVRYRDILAAGLGALARFASPSLTPARAANGILLAEEAWHSGATVTPDRLLPVYIRPSEAELSRRNS